MELKSKATVCALLVTLLLLSRNNNNIIICWLNVFFFRRSASSILTSFTDDGNGGGGGGKMVAEARVCMGKSQHRSFPCISDRLCSNECVKEEGGWTAGYCHLRYCRCQKAC